MSAGEVQQPTGSRGERGFARVRRAVASGLLVVLVASASLVGLHDWADEQTTGPGAGAEHV